MKKFSIVLLIALSALTATASTPTDRHFYVTFTYTDCCGVLRVGSIGYSCPAGYPKTTDLILKAADATLSSHKGIQITGIAAICASDYNNLFKGK